MVYNCFFFAGSRGTRWDMAHVDYLLDLVHANYSAIRDKQTKKNQIWKEFASAINGQVGEICF